MPCFLTQRLLVDLSKVPSGYVLQSLRALDYAHITEGDSVHVILKNGDEVTYRKDGTLVITARNNDRTAEIENLVKCGISDAVLLDAADRYSWQLNKVGESDGAVEYEVESGRGF